MDSFPQLQRCFERQWAGLDELARQWLDANAKSGGWYVPGYPYEVPPCRTYDVWFVADDFSSAPDHRLISVKID